jgi:hypothetical protein
MELALTARSQLQPKEQLSHPRCPVGWFFVETDLIEQKQKQWARSCLLTSALNLSLISYLYRRKQVDSPHLRGKTAVKSTLMVA